MQDALSEHVNMGASWGGASVMDSIGKAEGEKGRCRKCSIGGQDRFIVSRVQEIGNVGKEGI